jgi:hypothetical protein
MPYGTEARPHPRAGMAIGAAVVVGWVGVIGVAIAGDDSPSAETRATPYSVGAESPTARPGRVGPGYHEPGAD